MRRLKQWTAALCALVLMVSAIPGAGAFEYKSMCPDCKVDMVCMPVQPTCIDDGYIQLECPVCHGKGTAHGALGIYGIENNGKAYGHTYDMREGGVCSRCNDDARPPQTRPGMDSAYLTGPDGHAHDYRLMGNMYARQDSEGHKKWVCQTCQAVLMEDVPCLDTNGMAQPGSTFRTPGSNSGGSTTNPGGTTTNPGGSTNPGGTANPGGSTTNPGEITNPGGADACDHAKQPASGWTYETEKATCAKEGRSYRVCKKCGFEETVQILPKTSHDWKTSSRPDGSRVKTCSVCGETKVESAAPPSVTKESPVTKDPSAKAMTSGTRNGNNPGCRMNAYLYRRSDGNLTRVEALREGDVAVEVYSPSFELLTARKISRELPYFGGFYNGRNYNYLIFGQANKSESNSQEVIRVVQYSKDWERLGAASIRGANTYMPFDGGGARCAELDGCLYINTCHTMYRTGDGYNHQANMLIAIQESSMDVIFSRHDISNPAFGYVSHSLNQFILADENGTLVALDHGDGYPRGMLAVRYNPASDGKPQVRDSVIIKRFPGASNDEDTYSTFGGFEESASSYIAVGCSGIGTCVPVVSTVSKKDFSKNTVKELTLDSKAAYTPQLVKISDSRFLALWNDKGGDSYYSDSLNYVFLDGSGNPSGPVRTAAAYLSDCQPIVSDGKVVWYATGAGFTTTAPYFYTIDTASGAFTSEGGPQASGQSGAQPGTAGQPGQPQTPPAVNAGENPFVDVAQGAYYYDGVVWALENNVTTGVTETQFQPNSTCTRGQVVTFLWRAKGCPEPRTQSNPFTDVKSSSPFYKAILWAQENGITTGTTATTFNPGGTCTNGHVLTFLWRANGQPAAGGSSSLASRYPNQYFTSAIGWAQARGLLSSDSMNPRSQCPRADIVTYLYRDASNS